MGKRILVVEDDELMGEKLQEELRGMGHIVTLVTNFKEAQVLLYDESSMFDVVVCDQNFPMFPPISTTGDSRPNTRPLGIVLIREVRLHDARYDKVPFILHTGEDGVDIKERCAQLSIKYCFKQYGLSLDRLCELIDDKVPA